MPFVFWLLVCNPNQSDCDAVARVKHEDIAHDFAIAQARERPGACVVVTLRGSVEGLYGQCAPMAEQ